MNAPLRTDRRQTTAAVKSFWAAWIACGLGLATAAGQEPTGGPQYQGFDETAGVIRNGPWRAGMPLGGLGCGKCELLPAGWFARFTWNHNWDLPTWEEPFVPSRGSFLALSVLDGPQRVTRWLRHGWLDEELTGAEQVQRVETRGTFPFAELTFGDEKLPIRARLRAWSPLVPHNVKDSSLPVAFLDLELENPTDRPMTVSALMSLENYIGIGGVRVHEGKQRWYFADASRQQPAVIAGSALQGLKFLTPNRFEGIGRNVAGEYYLLSDGPTTDRGWDALANGRDLVDDFAADGELSGVQIAAREGKVRPAGALCRKLALGPREKQTVHFVILWWMPSHVTLDLKDHGHYYQRDFPDAERLAAYAFDQHDRLERETGEWQRLVRESNLPAWLQRLTLNCVGALEANTLLTRDGEFAQMENPGRAEGGLGALAQRGAARAVVRAFFPELDRSELALFRACQQPNGELPRLCGNAYRGFPNPKVWQGLTNEPAASAAYLREVLQHFRATGDRAFLEDWSPSLKQAQAWLAATRTNAAANAGTEPSASQPAPVFLDGDLEAARRDYEMIYRYHKSPWRLPATISGAFNQPPADDQAHCSSTAPWTLLAGIAGADLDVAAHRLFVSPARGCRAAGLNELHVPLFFTRFWAQLDYGPQQFRLRILKQFGEPVELRELAAGPGSAAIALPKPLRAVAGEALDLSPWREQLCPPAESTGAAAAGPAREALSWSRSGTGTLSWWANASVEEPYPPSDALDGYRPTQWQTIAPVRTSDWFRLDLGEVRARRRIEIQMGQRMVLTIQGSNDGRAWQPLGTLSSDASRGPAWWAADLTPTPVRFLKLVPVADSNEPWSIYEIRLK